MAILRFGVFEFDRAAGELRKNGLRIHLPAQSVAILGLLLEKAGELVPRQEFQERLWQADTFVDFERGLNAGITRLRAALGEQAGQPRFLETVPRRGYRFIAPVTQLKPSPASATGAPRLIVLPFEQLQPDQPTAFLCLSLPDAITGSLAAFRSLVVRSSRAMKLGAAAAEADVDAVITGTLLRSGEQLRVSAQLIQVPAGTVVWTYTAQVPMGEIFWLQDELTRRIVASLLPSVAAPHEGGDGPRDVPATARAYEFYLRANYLSTQMRDLTLARDMYRSCLAEDPAYAPAWARLARCYRILAKFRADSDGNVARAEEAFQRAFALNPQLPGIHSQYAYHETDQGRAKDAIARLLRLLPYHPNAPDLYAALVYACRYAGLLEASLAAHESAQHLDRNARTSVMNTHFVMGNHQLALDTSTDDVGFMEAMALDALGRRQEALERVRRREHLPPLMTLWMRMLELYLEDRRDEAVAILLEMDRQGVDPEGFFYRARILARLGRTPEALTSLERALQAGFYCAPAWMGDCYLEPIRGTIRFQEMLTAVTERSAQARAAFVKA